VVGTVDLLSVYGTWGFFVSGMMGKFGY